MCDFLKSSSTSDQNVSSNVRIHQPNKNHNIARDLQQFSDLKNTSLKSSGCIWAIISQLSKHNPRPFHLSWRISLTSTPQVFSQSSPWGSIKVNIWEIHKPWKTAPKNPWEGFRSCMILDILVMTSCSNMFHDFFRWKILLWITRPHHPQCHRRNLVEQFPRTA